MLTRDAVSVRPGVGCSTCSRSCRSPSCGIPGCGVGGEHRDLQFPFLPPRHSVLVADSWEAFALGVFRITAAVVGELAARSRRQAREATRHTEEQVALRRSRPSSQQAAPASKVFEAVTREVGLLADADLARMERYERTGP
jgi:K+-sensing histidine kinase KdpD